MDLEQTVRAAFELREPRADFEDVVMARLSASSWRASQVSRRRKPIVLIGTLLAVAAAAAMLIASLMKGSPQVASSIAGPEAVVPVEASAITSSGLRTPERVSVPDEAPAQPASVSLVLDQATGDAIGRDYGLRVYERAREELRALPGLVLVDAGTSAAAAPAFRITYINLAVSSGSSIQVEMVFQVEALQPGADGAGVYKAVFRSSPPPPGVVDMPPSIQQMRSIPSYEQEPWLLLSSARVSVRPGAPLNVAVDCLERREGRRCAYTPADIAAFTILSWRLRSAPPDSRMVERLHAMLRDPSSPLGLWTMALVNLHEYQKLRLDSHELLAAWERIGEDDPALRAALMKEAIQTGSKADLMRRVRELLLGELPNGDRSSRNHMSLVGLLATEFRNEPDARATLESVAANDPVFEIRAAAKQALGLEPEAPPRPPPAPSFMGPIDEQ